MSSDQSSESDQEQEQKLRKSKRNLRSTRNSKNKINKALSKFEEAKKYGKKRSEQYIEEMETTNETNLEEINIRKSRRKTRKQKTKKNLSVKKVTEEDQNFIVGEDKLGYDQVSSDYSDEEYKPMGGNEQEEEEYNEEIEDDELYQLGENGETSGILYGFQSTSRAYDKKQKRLKKKRIAEEKKKERQLEKEKQQKREILVPEKQRISTMFKNLQQKSNNKNSKTKVNIKSKTSKKTKGEDQMLEDLLKELQDNPDGDLNLTSIINEQNKSSQNQNNLRNARKRKNQSQYINDDLINTKEIEKNKLQERRIYGEGANEENKKFFKSKQNNQNINNRNSNSNNSDNVGNSTSENDSKQKSNLMKMILESEENQTDKGKDSSNWRNLIQNESQSNPQTNEEEEEEKEKLDQKIFGQTSNFSKNNKLNTQEPLDFYWFDAYEDTFNNKGTIYLFGKVAVPNYQNRYASCCLAVRGLKRNIFLIIRKKHQLTGESVTEKQVLDEWSKIAKKNGINSYQTKFVKRKYIFKLNNAKEFKQNENKNGQEEGNVEEEEEEDFEYNENYQKKEFKCLKVVYDPKYRRIDSKLNGTTFQQIIGSPTSMLELFVIKKRLIGPSWLKISNFQISNRNFSWCTYDLIIDSYKKIEIGELNRSPPPFVLLSLSLKTYLNETNHKNEIVAASGVIQRNLSIDGTKPHGEIESFSCIRKLHGTFPTGFSEMVNNKFGNQKTTNKRQVNLFETETSLLNFLIAKIHRLDPDILLGHNFFGFNLDVLLQRLFTKNVDYWSKLGRLRRSRRPKLQAGAGGMRESTWEEKQIVAGRLICDTYLSSKEFLKEKSYSLKNLAATQLDVFRKQIDYTEFPLYFQQADKLLSLMDHCEGDAYLSYALMNKLSLIPLTKQITSIAGNLWSRVLQGSRSERVEYVLLHEFHQLKYLVPDKKFIKRSSTKTQYKKREKAKYSGGLVLTPKSGYYDHIILLLDFNSLYPSIIQEFNICLTTIPLNEDQRSSRIEQETTSNYDRQQGIFQEKGIKVIIPNSNSETGILPRIIKNLIERRKVVKNMIKREKNVNLLKQLNIKQLAFKLIANSMYGCLGFSFSRFFAKPLAELITTKGREILQKTVNIVNSNNFEVVYGDTDSVMIHTGTKNINEAKEIAHLIKNQVNRIYKSVYIDIDGIFGSMLLLRKKKYAAIILNEDPVTKKITKTKEVKGLDLVRRDWCGLSHDVGSLVLDSILSEISPDQIVEQIHTILRNLRSEILNGKIPLSKFVITKGLTKEPNLYQDAKSQPHVQVALKMIKNKKRVAVGQRIPYVICEPLNEEEKSASTAQRAYHPESVKKTNGELKIDIDWYLAQQILPPIIRLCQPIEGTSAQQLADCLGLSNRHIKSVSSYSRNNQNSISQQEAEMSYEEKFENVEKLFITCTRCKKNIEFLGIKDKNDNGLSCTNCHHHFNINRISNLILLFIRQKIKLYYLGWLVCEDCNQRTRHISLNSSGKKCPRKGCFGWLHEVYNSEKLNNQLEYLLSLVDLNDNNKWLELQPKKNLAFKEKLKFKKQYEQLKLIISNVLSKNSSRIISLKKVFSFMH
ncbi:DNA polymerase alpha catalytic subunit [Anaeramoeba flamelloides]|uniref:DNA polymerase n=1 Tax=Anaeramoeba flamelloides TaxID=1746091 RepID=A0ABQ8Z6P6_9EUKA|nr:DNA polymerase alpha catalytic subunit [Anaeramoeba flamelloides]